MNFQHEEIGAMPSQNASPLSLLQAIVQRQPLPEPWTEGEKIPWNDPAFSERMLHEHLSQEHDAASRRARLIDQHVHWIHQRFLKGKQARVLDLGCGPGLYTSRLARRGHHCTGIDFSPASIRYAREQAEAEGLSCDYVLGDLRQADFGEGLDLIMLIFGEFNVFAPTDAREILRRAYGALGPGGWLLLEPHTYAAVKRMADGRMSWYSSEGGLFSDQPHLCLMENIWDAGRHVATERYFIIDAASSAVTRYAASVQAYTDAQYKQLLLETGFSSITFYPSLTGAPQSNQTDLIAVIGQK